MCLLYQCLPQVVLKVCHHKPTTKTKKQIDTAESKPF